MNGSNLSLGQIAVIDDTAANLHLLSNLLETAGYDVRPFPRGKLALEGIAYSVPDLVLLDIQMPDMNGYEVCEKLKTHELTQTIPVIFISALNETVDKVKGFHVGGVDYISKPFQTEEVLARVATHLELYQIKKKLQKTNVFQAQKIAEQNLKLLKLNQSLEKSNRELKKKYDQLRQAQIQLVKTEKMATLGNLVAGVAHEINNPVSFIGGNLKPAEDYVQDLFGLIDLYQKKYPEFDADIEAEINAIELDYIRDDLPKLIASMQLGVVRIGHISTSLRTFSRTDKDHKVPFNLHEGLDSTILILKHRIKANENRPAIEIVKDYGKIPEVQCFPGQLNQVFMNLIANAIEALEEGNAGRSFEEIKTQPNRITIQTLQEGENVIIRIKDNGIGMPEEVKQRIFEQGFTTKGVGKGTGLGMAIARQIMVEKHGGTLEVCSTLGRGTEFEVALPIV